MRQIVSKAALAAMCLGLMASAAAIAAPAAGAGRAAGEGRATKAFEPIRSALATLNLNDEQKAKTDAILADASKQAEAMAAEARASADKGDEAKADRRKKTMELMQKTQASIVEQLNDDQKAAFKTAIADARKSAREANQANGDGAAKKDKPAADGAPKQRKEKPAAH